MTELLGEMEDKKVQHILIQYSGGKIRELWRGKI